MFSYVHRSDAQCWVMLGRGNLLYLLHMLKLGSGPSILESFQLPYMNSASHGPLMVNFQQDLAHPSGPLLPAISRSCTPCFPKDWAFRSQQPHLQLAHLQTTRMSRMSIRLPLVMSYDV